MLKVRKVKTGSGKTAVQVVRRRGRRTFVVKHIGTSSSKYGSEKLVKIAQNTILKREKTNPLFPEFFAEFKHDLVSIEHLKVTAARHTFAYEFLERYYKLSGFEKLENDLLKNLAIIRVVEPASKLRSIKLLKKYFDICLSKNYLYKNLSSVNHLKESAEKIATKCAKRHLSFDFNLVFFDITTLYFETFKEDKDEFKKPGFSKDGKPNQPQILVSLVVTKEGYPVACDLFAGNKFEGHTMIPVIENFKEKNKVKTLTVVADAAMISFDNITKLNSKNLNYIVGARVSNLPLDLIKEVSTFLDRKKGVYFQTETRHGTLICDYSQKRANKNRSDRKRQIAKAQRQINNPSKVVKRLRFLKQDYKTRLVLNQKLIEKDELLEGIKGYYTNLKGVNPSLIISRYKDLWHVEKAFRIAKSDLLARPIYHYKKKSIKAHILIVFVSLCLAKLIEIKTGKSIKRIVDEIWEVLDVDLQDTLTGKKYTKRSEY